MAGTRALTQRMIRWGVVSGIVTGLLLAVASPFLGALFTSDPDVQALLVPVLLVAALGQPVAGRGLRAGRGADRCRRRSLPGPRRAGRPGRLRPGRRSACALASVGLVGVWVAFCAVFMGARLVVLLHRARGDAWLVTGLAAPAAGA